MLGSLCGGLQSYLKIFLLDLNNNSDCLTIELNQVTELVLAKRVYSSSHVCAQLQIPGKDFELMHSKVRKKYNHVVQDAHNESCVALVTASNHLLSKHKTNSVYNIFKKGK